MIIIDTLNLVVDPQWKNVQQQEVFLECDTTQGVVSINLFEIADLNRFWNVKVIISDYGNNASVNNIVITAGGGDLIDQDGTVQIVLNLNGESVTFQPVSETSWIALESVGGAVAIPTLQEVLDNNHDLVDGNNFQGASAGSNNGGLNVNAFGTQAAEDNRGSGCNFFGTAAGQDNQDTNVHGFGENAGRRNQSRHAVFIGAQAGYDVATNTGNAIGGVFVVNNTILTSFPDFATAQATLTVLNGAVAGNTYLFYDASKGVIGAIRL
jgi:hypothetical protein